MCSSAVRLRTAIVVVALAVAGGCGGDQPLPEPEPDPGPRYEQIPEDLCDRVRLEEVAERFDLSLAPSHERSSNYSVERTHWYEWCSFSSRAADDRFSADLVDFGPGGLVAVEVYYEVADAEEKYQQLLRGYERRREVQPGAIVTELSGWWDTGMWMEWSREVEPEAYSGEDEITSLVVSQFVRHGNLVVEGGLTATSLADDADEAMALMRDLQRALIDEVVEHLTRTPE